MYSDSLKTPRKIIFEPTKKITFDAKVMEFHKYKVMTYFVKCFREVEVNRVNLASFFKHFMNVVKNM
jgi:tRNA(His) 5'-end guanylyltransferase